LHRVVRQEALAHLRTSSMLFGAVAIARRVIPFESQR
jgi:hypothetical protein